MNLHVLDITFEPFTFEHFILSYSLVSSDTQTDFTSLASTTLSFDECERLVCVSITIMNDTMVENTESFNVTLTWTTSLDRRQTEDRRRIKLNPLQVDGVVRITDDDGKNLNEHFVIAYLGAI